MLKMKIFLVLLFSSVVWAVPFNVEVVKKGDGDEIRSGQLIKVHYKGYLYADIVKFDSLKVAAAAESAEKAKQDSIAAAAKKDSKSKAKDKKAEALAAMEVQAAACRRQQEEFSEYMDRVAEDIQQKSERFAAVAPGGKDGKQHASAVQRQRGKQIDGGHGEVCEREPAHKYRISRF